jgi:phosphocarrier protein HPr
MPESCEAAITLAGDLHARPAGSLAVAAAKFRSTVELAVGAGKADGRSVLGIMGLGAITGQQVTIRAAGPDAQEAVSAMIEILAEATKVGEPSAARAPRGNA